MISRSTAAFVLILLAFGPLNTVLTKVTFGQTSVGIEGEEKQFHKPWFNTLRMFVGMAPAVLAHFVKVFIDSRARKSSKHESLLVRTQSTEPSFVKASMWVAIPACLDLLGTIVSYVGLMYNSASVFTMMRGSIIVFSAILSVLFLGRKMRVHNWVGVGLCVVAVTLVGTANIMGHDSAASGSSPALVVFGMSMIILSQMIQALQMVTEEKLMKGMDISPFLVVGMEGVWGLLMMACVCLPVVYMIPGEDAGSMENTFDTLVMLGNNPSMNSLMGIYVVSIFLTNLSGVLVTKALGSVQRTMISAMQTAVVWASGLFIYYCVDSTMPFGEKWTSWSWMQLAGFTLLVFGQSVYAEVIRLPGFYYPPKELSVRMPMRSPASVRNMVPGVNQTAEKHQ